MLDRNFPHQKQENVVDLGARRTVPAGNGKRQSLRSPGRGIDRRAPSLSAMIAGRLGSVERLEDAGIAVAKTPPPAATDSNVRSKAHFEQLINAAWQKSVEGIFDTGNILSAAQQELDTDVFKALRLPFSVRTRDRLVKIAAHAVLATHVSQLPPHWGTLYALTQVPDKVLLAKFRDGTIAPGLERKDVRLKVLGLPPKMPKPESGPDPIAVWSAFSKDQKQKILDSEGRSGVAKLLSRELMVDLVDHSIRQEMTGASTELKPAISLTAILRATLDPAVNNSVVFERFKAKLKSLDLDLHDISIALKKRGQR